MWGALATWLRSAYQRRSWFGEGFCAQTKNLTEKLKFDVKYSILNM